jgi:hypothetical protein
MNTVQTQRADTTNASTSTELARIEQNARRKQLRRIKSLKVDFFSTLSRLSDSVYLTKGLQEHAHRTLAEIAELSNEHCLWFHPVLAPESSLAIALAVLIDDAAA